MKKRIVKVILWILMLTLMSVIFYFSNQEAVKSSKTSSETIRFIMKIVMPDYETTPESELAEIETSVTKLVRKLAHFSIYGGLGFLSLLTFSRYNLSRRKLYTVSAVFCFLYAVSDELHQYFIPGRSCEALDVLIDFSGSVCGMVFLTLAYIIICKYKKAVFKQDRNIISI